MEKLEKQILEAQKQKAARKIKNLRGTKERYLSTQTELERLIRKRDNLNVQIQSLQAKQQARLNQLQNLRTM